MNDLRKAAEMALEAMDDVTFGRVDKFSDARKALRQALAQPKREWVGLTPVAWVLHGELFWPSEYEVISEAGDNAIPLYITPPKREWVGLTDEEVDEIYMHEGHEDVVLLTQAKLKEKNT